MTKFFVLIPMIEEKNFHLYHIFNFAYFKFKLTKEQKKRAHTEIRTLTKGFRVPCATLTPYELCRRPTLYYALIGTAQFFFVKLCLYCDAMVLNWRLVNKF